MKYNRASGVKFKCVYQGRGTGSPGKYGVQLFTDYLQFVLQVFLVGDPHRGGILQD